MHNSQVVRFANISKGQGQKSDKKIEGRSATLPKHWG